MGRTDSALDAVFTLSLLGRFFFKEGKYSIPSIRSIPLVTLITLKKKKIEKPFLFILKDFHLTLPAPESCMQLIWLVYVIMLFDCFCGARHLKVKLEREGSIIQVKLHERVSASSHISH